MTNTESIPLEPQPSDRLDAGAETHHPNASSVYVGQVAVAGEVVASRRSEITQAYGDFKPVIDLDNLVEIAKNQGMRLEYERFMGQGEHSAVFMITVGGRDFVARIPKSNDRHVGNALVESHLVAAELGHNIPGLEQFVAGSLEDGVVISEIMPGSSIAHVASEELAMVKADQLDRLVETIIQAKERGIFIDPNPSNIFYDTEAGFGIIDYHSQAQQKTNQSLGDIITLVARNIQDAGSRNRNNHRVEKSELDILVLKKRILEQFEVQVKAKLSGEQLAVAVKGVGTNIEQLSKDIADRSDPVNVQEQADQRATNLSEGVLREMDLL
jgi:hypothetical protein